MANGVRATCLWGYERALPRALCHIPETRIVACPSRGETLSNVPFEVALWAREHGTVVVCPAADGFVEQVTDNVTGLTYERDEGPEALTEVIRRALATDQPTSRSIRQAAYREVVAKRDAAVNVAAALRRYWSPA